MLQADVLPNMAFSSTRKRLVHSYECVKEEDSGLMEIEETGVQQDEKRTVVTAEQDENRSEL